MTRPLTQSDILFPSSQSPTISSTLSSLKRSALSITNRLSSITSDSTFIITVSTTYGLPLIANERCGSWYIPPAKKVESAYFKSTDGHMRQWGFSLRRVNLQILKVLGQMGGAVIVDSTRRGKSMPDALSKTIPIWCCVLNRALFPEKGSHDLHTPPQAVSQSEHAQISARIDTFVQQFLEICNPNLPHLRTQISKPLRPIWVTQTSTLPDAAPMFPDFHPVVLCTASRRVNGAEGSEGGYIQGAADDHEAWAQGLTPSLFWKHKERLLGTNEEDLPDLIAELVREEKGSDAVPVLIEPTKWLYVSTMQNLNLAPFDVIISCTSEPLTTTIPEYVKAKQHLHLRCQDGKLGSRDLRTQLNFLPAFFSTLASPPGKILVCCHTGKDLSVGVALAILCLYTDANGAFSTEKRTTKPDKKYIKQRLAWLTTTNATLNPPRGTLQSINAFLMPDPSAPPNIPASIPPTQSQLQLVGPDGTPTQEAQPPIAASPAPDPASSPSSPRSKASAIFSALETSTLPWNFTRTLTSKLPTHPSGTVVGTATFTPYDIPSTSSSTTNVVTPSTSNPPPTLLYAEEGDFTTTTNLRFSARRKYIYQLKTPATNNATDNSDDTTSAETASAEGDYIAIYFHDDTSPATQNIGDLFVETGALSESTSSSGVVLHATNRKQHLCAADLYTARWRFGGGMVGEGEVWWEVRYDVKGPRKDYVSETRYTRV